MRFEISRSDTGQYIFREPVSDTVVVDDELESGFQRIEDVCGALEEGEHRQSSEPSAFSFQGGLKYAPIAIAIALSILVGGLLLVGLDELERVSVEQHLRLDDAEEQLEELRGELDALKLQKRANPKARKKRPKKSVKPKPKPAKKAPEAKAPDAASGPA